MRLSNLLSKCLCLVLVAAFIKACGYIEIKPAYDTNSASAESEQVRAPAPIKFHNQPPPAATAAISADNAPAVTASAEASALVQTVALRPSGAVIEETELSELPELIDASSVVRELTNSVEAPLIAPVSLDLAQIATPVLEVEEETPGSNQGVDANNSEANASTQAGTASGQPLLSRTPTATIIPNILVESQIPELAVEPAEAEDANTSAESTSPAPESATSHTVVEGETVYSIASKYGVSIEQLAELNSISAPNYLIYPEMILKVKAGVASEVENYTEHEVKEGETVYSIALLYGMQPEELAQINDIAIPQYLIYPKTVLQVRSLEANSSASAADSGNALNAEDWQWPLADYAEIRDSSINGSSGILLVASAGDTVLAARSGKVVVVGEQIRTISLMVLIQHDGGYFSTYGHMQELTVNEGDAIVAGQALGRLDNKGSLYFGIANNDSTSIDVRALLGDDS